MFGIGKIAVFRHIDGRMRPVPGVICSVIAVQHVITGFFQELCGYFTFLHVTACLSEFFSGKSAGAEAFCFGDNAVAQGNREITPAFLLDRFDDFSRKTVAVFKRTAIVIGSCVDIFQCELIKKIAFMDRVHFNAIHPGLLQQYRAFCERVNVFLNLFNTQWS